MRSITEHLTSDAAQRYASLAGATAVVQRTAVGQTYWYAVPNEMSRRHADALIDEQVRWRMWADGMPVCRRCALPIEGDAVGEYHAQCVPVPAPADPQLFECWAS